MQDVKPDELYTVEVSGFYGPGSLLAWRLTLFSTILTLLPHRLGKRTSKEVAFAELLGLGVYPLLATGDLILKRFQKPYDWSLLYAIDDFRPYKFVTYLVYGTPFDKHLSTGLKTQFVDLYLPCLIIDNYIPISALVLMAAGVYDNSLLPPVTRYPLYLFLYLTCIGCCLGGTLANAMLTWDEDSGAFTYTLWSLYVMTKAFTGLSFPTIPPPPNKSLFIFPILYRIARELVAVARSLAFRSPGTIKRLKSHCGRIFQQIAILAWALGYWCVSIFLFGTLALVPAYPDIGLSFGDLDQAATLSTGAILFCYSLYDFFDGFDWKRLINLLLRRGPVRPKTGPKQVSWV
ncbi:hypothetical protein NM208_g9769 [Fusarium decemcellulare]|uniref:Uncharacterized protein n=1 Tax=Fusarium decemcellulare TaxID=57161 RepID=A0ACC1S0C4_9HYPO|nr:hypothetical protein NM208_g9769 [Fusarium decemcellulare]